MTINYQGRTYAFRACDVNGRTKAEIEALAEKAGHLQHEPQGVWLCVPGVGYAWEATEADRENFEHCRRIAQEVEEVAEGVIYMKQRVHRFGTFGAFEASNTAGLENVVTVIDDRLNKDAATDNICIDLMTQCAKPETAVKRLFRAVGDDDRLTGWEDCIVEAMENGYYSMEEKGEWSYGVEAHGDDDRPLWYVFLNVRLPKAEDEEPTEEQERAEALQVIEAAQIAIDAAIRRSAWDRGVDVYAAELLEDLAEAVKGGWVEPWQLQSRDQKIRAMLNGASSWDQYSWGGCSLIYDTDIAERLCTPSELRRTRGGERQPNNCEQWLDVQARALYQAANRASKAIKTAYETR